MNCEHFIECTNQDVEWGENGCICELLSAAFERGWKAGHQRGREDAARAVEALGSLRCYEVYEADDGYLAGSYYEVDAAAAARGDVADKTDKSTGGRGGLVSRENVSPSSVATTHNIDDSECVVNVTRAAVVNIEGAANINIVAAARGDGEQE